MHVRLSSSILPVLVIALGGLARPVSADSLPSPSTYPIQVAQAAPAPASADAKVELAFWNTIKDSKSAADYQAYLDKYPNGNFADLARLRLKRYATPAATPPAAAPAASTPAATPPAAAATADPRLAELDYWNSIKDSKSPEDFQAYLTKYPKGEFVDLAQLRLQKLSSAAPAATPTPAAPTTPAPAAQPASTVAMPEFDAASDKLYARSGARVRAAPDRGGAVLARLSPNTELTATGRTTDGNWWRVTLADGRTGYLANSTVSQQPVAVAPAAKPASQAAAAPVGNDQEVCKPGSAVAPNDRAAACERLANAAGLSDTAKIAALDNLAAALETAQRYDEAIRKYEQVAALDPNNPKSYYKIGLVRLRQHRFPEARAAFDKSASLNSKDEDTVFERGVAWVGIGDFESARLEVKRALLTKDDTRYYDELGAIELARGDVPAAKAAIDRALKLDPKFRSLTALAVDYYAGAYDLAAEQGGGVAVGGPDAPRAALWNALVRKAKGDAAGASQALEAGRAYLGAKDWPGPLFDYLQGKIPIGKLVAAAKTSDGQVQSERQCESKFFIGEWTFLAGDKAGARAALQDAVGSRIYYFLEYAAAKARLSVMAHE